MARCVSPWTKDGQPLPCGKCYECKARRVSSWSFRLLKEAERSSSAFFVTLTYDQLNVPMIKNNMMTLFKPDVQNWMKALRKVCPEKLKYYACGEYGTLTMRPHYHVILFNADMTKIPETWTKGEVHIGELTPASVGYTLKYISKKGKVPVHRNDQRLPEFSLMSKKMGDNYLTPQMKKWHKKDLLNRAYVGLPDGKKIALPRYYMDKIYTKMDKERIVKHIENEEIKEEQKLTREKSWEIQEKNSKIVIEKYKRNDKDNRKTSI